MDATTKLEGALRTHHGTIRIHIRAPLAPGTKQTILFACHEVLKEHQRVQDHWEYAFLSLNMMPVRGRLQCHGILCTSSGLSIAHEHGAEPIALAQLTLHTLQRQLAERGSAEIGEMERRGEVHAI